MKKKVSFLSARQRGAEGGDFLHPINAVLEIRSGEYLNFALGGKSYGRKGEMEPSELSSSLCPPSTFSRGLLLLPSHLSALHIARRSLDDGRQTDRPISLSPSSSSFFQSSSPPPQSSFSPLSLSPIFPKEGGSLIRSFPTIFPPPHSAIPSRA